MSICARDERQDRNPIGRCLGYFRSCVDPVNSKGSNAAVPWWVEDERHSSYLRMVARLEPLTILDLPVDVVLIVDALGTGIPLLVMKDVLDTFRHIFNVIRVATTEPDQGMHKIANVLCPASLLFPGAVHEHFQRTSDLILHLPRLLTSPRPDSKPVMVLASSAPSTADVMASPFFENGQGVHGQVCRAVFDWHRCLQTINTIVGPHRYLALTDFVIFSHDQDRQEMSAMFGKPAYLDSVAATGIRRLRTVFTYPLVPLPAVASRILWNEDTSELPAGFGFPSNFLRDAAEEPELHRMMLQEYSDGGIALPSIRAEYFLDIHQQHLDHVILGSTAFNTNKSYVKYAVLSGYLEHDELGPVWWPREWLMTRFGLTLTERADLDRQLPCEQHGTCAKDNQRHCDNCQLIAVGLAVAWHRPTYTGLFKRLVALWLSGRCEGQAQQWGHTIPVHICGSACVHARNTHPTDRARGLIRARRDL